MSEPIIKKKSLSAPVQAWLADLRSGKFPRGKGKLKTADGGFCCLGVACETAIRLGLPLSAMPPESPWPRGYRAANSESTFYSIAPDMVMELLELHDVAGKFLIPLAARTASDHLGYFRGLTTLNDNTNLTFSEIADFIEQNAEHIFR